MRRTGLVAAALTAFAVAAPLAGGASLDPAGPTIVSSTPAPPANQNNPILNGTADPRSLVFLYADSSCAADFVEGVLADASGEFHIEVTVNDNTTTTFFAAAAPGSCSDGFTYVEDSRPPTRPLVAGPPDPSSSTTARFAFASERGASFLCSLDRGAFSPCSNPQVYTVGEGTHALVVEAVDAAGNVSDPSTPYSWTVDLVPPESADRAPPQNVWRLRRDIGYGVFRLRWKRPADADFDHVRVFVSTKPSRSPRTLVYTGKRQWYTNKRFKNGLYHRYLVISYDHADNASQGAPSVVPTSALLQSPRSGQVVHAPPVLRWAGVRRSTFYNVQLYHSGHKILSAWPKKPRLALAQRWVYLRRSFSLRKGAYIWFVWPAFGAGRKSHYGQLLGQGTFRVR